MALVGLELERIRQEEDRDAEGADLEEESGGRGGPRRAPSSPPSMADGGEDEPKTKHFEIKI
jgi:hypothetical protein